MPPPLTYVLHDDVFGTPPFLSASVPDNISSMRNVLTFVCGQGETRTTKDKCSCSIQTSACQKYYRFRLTSGTKQALLDGLDHQANVQQTSNRRFVVVLITPVNPETTAMTSHWLLVSQPTLDLLKGLLHHALSEKEYMIEDVEPIYVHWESARSLRLPVLENGRGYVLEDVHSKYRMLHVRYSTPGGPGWVSDELKVIAPVEVFTDDIRDRLLATSVFEETEDIKRLIAGNVNYRVLELS